MRSTNKQRVTLVVAALAALSVNVSKASLHAQEPGNPPPLAYPLRDLPTDMQIMSALSGSDERLKEVIVRRGKLLPAHLLTSATVGAIADELIRISADVRRRFKESPVLVNEDNSRFEYRVSLAEVLIQQENPAGIDGLAAVVHFGAPGAALVEFGDRAVPALVKAARTGNQDEPGLASAAMDVLEQMLESQTVGPTLSAGSRVAVRQVASEWLVSAKGNDDWRTLASAAYLAVATGDDQLRKQVTNLIDNDSEFIRRGMDIHWQQQVSNSARQALAKFPSNR